MRAIVCVAAAAAVLACGAGQARAALRGGYHAAFAGQGEIYETLIHTNILALNGVDAGFKVFAYGGPLAEAAVAGELDLGLAADVPILRVVGRRPGWKVVGRTHDWTWSVLARPGAGVTDLASLRGKRLGAPFGTSVFPRAVRHLTEAGMKEPFKDVQLVNGELADQAQALRSGAVDAVVSWPPTSSRIVELGLARPVYASAPGDGLAWQALGPEVLKDRGLAVRYLKAFIMAVWWASNHLDQAQRWYAKTSGISPATLRGLAKDDRYLRAPVKDLKRIDLSIEPSEIAEVQGVVDFLVKQQLLSQRIDVAQAVDDSYVRQAQTEMAQGRHPPLAAIRVVAP